MENAVPPITKIYLIGIFITSIIITLKLINPNYFMIIRDLKYCHQFWRYIWSVCLFSEINMGLIFNLVFIYSVFNDLERKSISINKYEDFILLILFSYFTNWISGLFFTNALILSRSFFNTLLYIFCRKYPENRFNIYFVFTVKAYYFVILNSIMDVLLFDENIFIVLFSLLFGHIYIFLKDIYPLKTNKFILKPPLFFKKIGNLLLKLNNEKIEINNNNYRNNLNPMNRPFQGRHIVN